jgi:ribonucleotide monophosphatase NagD (HAD superfamily)
MVGDDVVSDVLDTQAAGMTGILVRTGKAPPESMHTLSDQPDVVLDSFREVPEWLADAGA